MANKAKPGVLNQLSTPILLLIHKRADKASEVLKAIRYVRPKKLYIAGDGPKEGQQSMVIETRKVVLESIDWDCEVQTLFQEKNLGCKYGVYNGINWFFENEDEGIIIEDDVVPDQSFFSFCEQMLISYRNDEKVGMISGNNRFENKQKQSSFFFSKHGLIWGWATWKRAWEKMDIEMNTYDNQAKKTLKQNIGSTFVYKFWEKKFDEVAFKGLDTWDFQWTYARYINSLLTIRPKVNLVKNIGFGAGATHTLGKGNPKFLTHKALDLPLTFPEEIIADSREDLKLELEWIINWSLLTIKNKVKRLIN